MGFDKSFTRFFHGQEFSLCENELRSPHLSLRFPKGSNETFNKIPMTVVMGIFGFYVFANKNISIISKENAGDISPCLFL